MSGARLQRVAEEIKKEVGGIIQEELNDPRIGFVTITRVEVSRDLRVAKIFFSHLGDKKKLRDTQVGLGQSRGFIRKLLGERIKLRYTPEIIFKFDENIEYSIHISELLDKIKNKDKSNEHRKDN